MGPGSRAPVTSDPQLAHRDREGARTRASCSPPDLEWLTAHEGRDGIGMSSATEVR
jgi:hypothetical protein